MRTNWYENKIGVVDLAQMAVVKKLPTAEKPDGIAYAGPFHKAYVSDERGRAEAIVDVREDRIIKTLHFDSETGVPQYDPVARKVYVNLQDDNAVAVIDPASDTVVGQYAVSRSNKRSTASRSMWRPTECTRRKKRNWAGRSRGSSCSRRSPEQHRIAGSPGFMAQTAGDRAEPRRMARFGVGIVGIAMVLLAADPASAYRPFISTDAAVADPKEIEIELGALTLSRTGHENTLTTPSVVANYGVLERWELVAEFHVQEASGTEITDPGVFFKGVLKEGVLQDKDGVSLAVEAGPLLPSTVKGERGVGFEGTGILSGRLAPMTFHVNVGGGVDRSEARPFVSWGLIGELPMTGRFRFVSEVNGESTKGQRPDNAVLAGFIWQPSSSNIFLDAAIRRGISSGAPDWEFTAGVTFGFKLAPSPRHGPGS